MSQVERWLSRWAPLSGAVAGILVAVSIFSGSNTPDNNAPPGQVARFYLQHATGQKVSAIAGILAMATANRTRKAMPRIPAMADTFCPVACCR